VGQTRGGTGERHGKHRGRFEADRGRC
jgi:hypothetical protein